jgi:hypothetical protein
VLNLFQTASASADRLALTCLTEPLRTQTGVKTYEAQLFSNLTVGYKKMIVYLNEGSQRKVVSKHELRFRSLGNRSEASEISDQKTGDVLVIYRERAAPTREGLIYINDQNKKLELPVTCYL